MRHLTRDLKFAIRMLARYPTFSVLSVFAIALAMHLVTGQLLVINGLLFNELPLPEEGQLVAVANESGERHKIYGALPPAAVAELNEGQKSFVGLAGFYNGTVNFVDSGTADRYGGAFISPNFLEVFNVEPVLGRGFRGDGTDGAAAREVMISHRVWQDRFAGSRDVLGRTVKVNAEPAVIVGVMPAGVRIPVNEDVWLPLFSISMHASENEMWVNVIGRVKEGVDRAEAERDLNAIAEQARTDGGEMWNWFSHLELLSYRSAFMDSEMSNMLWIMLGAVLLVLLIGCANVANLLLARSTVRVRELAVRSAVGATRGRLIRQMLIESLVLCLIGGVIGLITASWSIDGVTKFLRREEMPFWMVIDFDPAVFWVVILVTVVASVVAGLVPAFRASRTDLNELLKDTARTSTNRQTGWFVRGLVAVQVAMSFALLIVAGVMVKAIADMENVLVPYDLERIGSARFGLFSGDYPTDDDVFHFLTDLRQMLASDRAIVGAAITRRQRFDGSEQMVLLQPMPAELSAEDPPKVMVEAVSSGYFEALGVDLLSGREFGDDEWRTGAAVAVVNESFARMWFGDAEPVGKRITLKGKEGEVFEVVGVATDMQMQGVGLGRDDQAGVYVPIRSERGRFFTVLFRSEDPARGVLPVLRRTVARLNPELPLYWVMNYTQAIGQSLAAISLAADLFAIFGLAAVLLAAVGIYGVVSFTVSQRTPEIGIRMALGARRSGLVSMIMRQGLAQLVVGLAGGVLLALTIERLMAGLIGSMPAFDGTVFLAMGVVVTFVVFVSSFVPVRRAVRLSPFDALQHE